MTRLFATFLSVLVSLLGLVTQAVSCVAVTASPTVVCTFDSTHVSLLTADAAAERGPPALPVRHFTYAADDRGSPAAAARTDGASVGSTTTYVASAKFVRAALATGTTWTSVQSGVGDLSSPVRAGVAANAAPKVGWGVGDDI